MAKKVPTSINQKRKPRLLWANPFCLIDTSSGGSMSVRQMLKQMVASGYEVQIMGATIFDDPKGMGVLREKLPNLYKHLHQMIEVADGVLTHQLLVTQHTVRDYLTSHEEGLWYSQYCYLLDTFKPDVVWFYGGLTMDFLIADEARTRGVPSVAYLVNSNYKSHRWCRDVDLIITDTLATSTMYRKSVGFVPKPIGKFIETEQFVASHHQRERLLFVNPSWPKGASVFVQLAERLERERPDIVLEVVESRADWTYVLEKTTQQMGQQRVALNNVVITPNTSDMREPYSRARILMAPSLWWESGARVLAEAMLNGIPAIVSDSGGNREMVGEGGWVVELPEACFVEPYQYLLNDKELEPLFNAVISLFDNEQLYQEYVQNARYVGQKRHHIRVSTAKLLDAFAPLVNQRAGNKEFKKVQGRTHKHKLVGRAAKPEFKAKPIPSTPPVEPSKKEVKKTYVNKLPTQDFDWQLKSQIVVLDSRIKLLKTGVADTLASTNVFNILAFDPASEVQHPNAHEGHKHIQLFQHALLGDGQSTKMNVCLDAALSSPLLPLTEGALAERHREGAKVLTQLPISTIALDSIEGLPSLDWLILDELSNVATILAHGEKALKDVLLIQARVVFQPTHEKQPSLAELQHWASRNGFRFYRFNDMRHHSLLGNEQSGVSENQASELESADVLFLPTDERLKSMAESQLRKLAFLLHTVFGAHDAAYQILSRLDDLLAKDYLRSVNGDFQQYTQTNSAKGIVSDQDKGQKKHQVVPSQTVKGRQFPEAMLEQLKGTTMVTLDRLVSLYRSTFSVLERSVPGDLVECGVYRGGCAMVMANVLSAQNDSDRHIWLYDTFEGMSAPTEKDKRLGAGSSEQVRKRFEKEQKDDYNAWCYGPLDIVKSNVAKTDFDPSRLHFVKGMVEETLPDSGMPNEIAILRLDTDWYESTLHELIHLFPRLSAGGVLIIDDYYYWEGCKKAVDEYFGDHPCELYACRVGISLVIVKTPSYIDWQPQEEDIAPSEELVKKESQKKLTPDEAVAKLLPDSTLEKPGSIRWLIEKEKQFGGLVQNVERNKVSPRDARTPEQIRRGGMQGGDRMSFNLHGYALAYAAFFRPMLEETKSQPLTLMEVGILKGSGLAIWCDLFPTANVLGLDIDLEHCRQNIPHLKECGAFKYNQPELHEFDQYEGQTAQIAGMLQGNKVDVFIDDGVHTRKVILNTFKALKPHLADTFVAFIEDNATIATELRRLLPEFRVLSQGEITVICPDDEIFPRCLPTFKQLAFEIQVMQKRLGYQPNLEYPQTFNEKIARRKLFGAPANAAILADKLAVRDYVKERVGDEILTEIYQIVDSPKQIDWDALPNQFVMKSNHGNAQVKIVRDKKALNKKEAEALCQTWLNSVYGQNSNEYWYAEIPPKVYFEELILEGNEVAADYKVHVFNGEPKLIQKISGRFGKPHETFYFSDWSLAPYRLTYPKGKKSKKPEALNKVLELSSSLAKEIDYIRVDFYLIGNKVFFGELTFAPAAGWDQWKVDSGELTPHQVDKEIGAWWD